MPDTKTYVVLDFKLAVASGKEFTDEEIEHILLATEIATEQEILDVVNTLKEYRPALYEKIKSEFPLFQRR